MAEEKILQSEMMSDEELEGVAGGTYAELREDVDFLKNVGLLDKNFSGNDDQMSLKVNQIVSKFKFQVIVDPHGKNIVRHFNRHNQPRNSSRELMHDAILREISKPDFDFSQFK